MLTASPAGANPPPAKIPTIPTKPSKPRGTSSAIFFGPCSRAGNSIPRRKSPICSGKSAATTWPKPPSKPRSGTPKPNNKNLPLAKLLGGVRDEISSGVSIGIQPSIEELIAKVEKELAAGYQRIKIKIKPGDDVEPSSRPARKIPAHPPDGGRQFRLSPGRRAAPQAARPVFPDHDRAAARLRRHLLPRRAAAPARNAHLPRRVHPRLSNTPAPPSKSAPAKSSI